MTESDAQPLAPAEGALVDGAVRLLTWRYRLLALILALLVVALCCAERLPPAGLLAGGLGLGLLYSGLVLLRWRWRSDLLVLPAVAVLVIGPQVLARSYGWEQKPGPLVAGLLPAVVFATVLALFAPAVRGFCRLPQA